MSSQKTTKKETSLYHPVREHFQSLGFRVLGEVCECDIAGWDGKSLIVVELKLSLNLTLIAQAAQRQKFADVVWAAVPKPKNKRRWTRTNADSIHVLKRLGIGLLLVPMGKSKTGVEEVVVPTGRLPRISQVRKKAIIQEMEGRTGDQNQGGSTRTAIITAYRESAMQIAKHLMQHGAMSPKQLRELGCHEKTQRILYANYYGWFESPSRGKYLLTEKGRAENS